MNIHLLPEVGLNNKANLRKFIKNIDSISTVYICFGSHCLHTSVEMKEVNINLLNIKNISFKERDLILKDYVDMVGKMSCVNGKYKQWWSTDIASKNRILSPVQEVLNQVVLSIKAVYMCKQDDLNLCIIGVEWPVVAFLKVFSKQINTNIYIYNEHIFKLLSKFGSLTKIWTQFLRDILHSLLNIFRTRIAFGRVYKINKKKPVFLIKSWIFPRSLHNNRHYNDPFCGDLALDLKKELENDVQIVTVSQGYIDRYKCYKKMKDVNDRIIFPAESFIMFTDVLLSIIPLSWYLISKSIIIPKKTKIFGHNFNPALRELSRHSGKFVRFNEYLYYYIGRRLAKNFILQGCVMSYEGNHWEKMFILGIRSVDKNIKIIGYHHSAICQASAGVFVSDHEISVTPTPDRIVTTGIISANIVKKYSSIASSNIWPGCAYVYKYLHNCAPLPIEKGPRVYTILVMLEGVFEASDLLNYAINQAYNFSNINFIVRSHPSLPVGVLLQSMNKRQEELPDNMIVSYYNDVVSDISRCDVGLYWGTATAVEVLMMGRPLIWFDRGDVLSFDPLFDFYEFKWCVQFETSISKAIEEINNLTYKEYKSKSLKGIKYVSKYFERCDNGNIKSFIS